MKDNTFSLYHNGITNVHPAKELTIKLFIELLKQDKPLFDLIRSEQDQSKRDKLKSKLSYVTPAGVFEKRSNKNLIQSSGFACIDLDHLQDLDETRAKLMANKYVNLIFLSPSGDGLKVFVKIPNVENNEEYKKYYVAIEEYFDIPETDGKCRDIARACYVSIDKAPYHNPNSETWTKQVEYTGPKGKKVERDYTPKDRNSDDILDMIFSYVSMEQVLSHFGVDTTTNPAECPFHHCSQRCLSFNSETAHCFDTDCAGDDSWNILSFVKKINNCDAAEAIKWLAEFGGLEKEYEESKRAFLQSLIEEERDLGEVKGWANDVSIVELAKQHNFINCPKCNSPFQFKDSHGLWYCKTCKKGGGLKKFAVLINMLNQQEKIQ